MSRRNRPYAGADARTRQARARGYPARSVFKLEEIDRRYRLLSAGQHVLDLGAAPGSWTKYASERVGSRGLVLAVDLRQIEQRFASNVRVLVADALSLDATEIERLGPYDVVLSDLAPSTSGSKVRDQTRSYDLFMQALKVAAMLGRSGSAMVGKIFMGPDFQSARRAVGERYDHTTVARPSGTRQASSEVFIVGRGLRK